MRGAVAGVVAAFIIAAGTGLTALPHVSAAQSPRYGTSAWYRGFYTGFEVQAVRPAAPRRAPAGHIRVSAHRRSATHTSAHEASRTRTLPSAKTRGARHVVRPLVRPAAVHARVQSAVVHRAVSAVATSGVTPAQAQMLALINAERAQAGVGALSFDSTLNTVAQARSQDMIDRHYFSHQIPGGGMVFDILDRDHVQYQMAGENIALNNYINFYPLAKTVHDTNTDLMNSPEHRANILEPKYGKIGIGLAFEKGSGKLILTEVFVQR